MAQYSDAAVIAQGTASAPTLISVCAARSCRSTSCCSLSARVLITASACFASAKRAKVSACALQSAEVRG